MVRLSIQVYLCCYLLILTMWNVEGGIGSGRTNCSCYTFHGERLSRNVSQHNCKIDGGNLVSMETTKEWEFIKTQIQNKTTSDGYNEWWIGLVKRDGEWRWVSNHSLTYNKWTPPGPGNEEGKNYAKIMKNLNGKQGLFNQTTESDRRGRICEYIKRNCSGQDKAYWCTHPDTTTLPVGFDTSTISNSSAAAMTESNHSAQNSSGCTIIKKETTLPLVIPIIIALVGLLVIACINIIVVKWKHTTKASNQKRDRPASPSNSEPVLTTEHGEASYVNFSGSRIKQNEEHLQSKQEINSWGDVRNNVKLERHQAYYVNVQDAEVTYASVSDTIDRQTDTMMVNTYATVNETVETKNQTDSCVLDPCGTVNDTKEIHRPQTIEPNYASVDVLHDNSQRSLSASVYNGENNRKGNGEHSKQAGNLPPRAEDPIKYAVVDMSKKRSKKIKTKEPGHGQKKPDLITEPNYACVDKSQRNPSASGHNRGKNSTINDGQTTQAGNPPPRAEEPIKYTVVDMSKKRSKKIKTKEPDHDQKKPDMSTEPNYASVDVLHNNSKRNPSVSGQSRENNTIGNEGHAIQAGNALPRAEESIKYAVVDIISKKSKKIKNKEPDHSQKKPVMSTEPNYASVDVLHNNNQRNSSVSGHDGENHKKGNDEHSALSGNQPSRAEEPIKKSGVDMSKKRSKKIKTKEQAMFTEAGYASADVIYANCDDRPNKGGCSSANAKQADNTQETPGNNLPTDAIPVQHAVVNKSIKKTNMSRKEAVSPYKFTEASHAAVSEENKPRHQTKL